MVSRVTLPATFVLVAMLAVPMEATNPGISVRVSQSMFDFALDNVVLPLLKKDLPKAKVPTVSYHIPIINTDLQVYQIEVTAVRLHPMSYIIPSSQYSGLEAKICIIINGRGLWSTRECIWPHITHHSTLDFDFNPLCIDVAMGMSPGPGGVWQFDVKHVDVVPHFSAKFHGFLSGFDIGPLRTYIDIKASHAIHNAINKAITTYLPEVTNIMKKYLPYVNYPDCHKAGLPVECQDFAMNLSLTSSGVWVQKCYGEIQLNGYVVYKKKVFLPTPAPAFPPVHDKCGDHMCSVLVSASTFSSALDAILGSGLLHFNAQTHHFADDPYYNQFVPALNTTFHHMPLYLNVSLTGADMTISPEDMAVTLDVIFQVLVDESPSKSSGIKFVEAFTMNLSTTFGLNVFTKPVLTPVGNFTSVIMNFTRYTVDSVEVVHSNVGKIDAVHVQDMMQKLLMKGFANANEVLNLGVVIIPPKVANFTIESPLIELGEGYLRLATNFSTGASPHVAAEEFSAGKFFSGGSRTASREDSSPFDMQLDSVPDMIDYTLYKISEAIATGHDHMLNIFHDVLMA